MFQVSLKLNTCPEGRRAGFRVREFASFHLQDCIRLGGQRDSLRKSLRYLEAVSGIFNQPKSVHHRNALRFLLRNREHERPDPGPSGASNSAHLLGCRALVHPHGRWELLLDFPSEYSSGPLTVCAPRTGALQTQTVIRTHSPGFGTVPRGCEMSIPGVLLPTVAHGFFLASGGLSWLMSSSTHHSTN